MSDGISDNELSGRIRASIWQVHDFMAEMHELLRLIQQGLESGDTPITSIRGKGFSLPREKRRATAADRFIKSDMGFVAIVGAAAEDTEEDDAEDVDDVEEDVADDDGKVVEVTPEFRFVGVRAVLIDPRDRELEPQVFAGVFGGVALARRKRGQPTGTAETSFPDLKRATLKKIVKSIGTDSTPRRSVTVRTSQGQLSAVLTDIFSKPIAEFRTRARVDEFAQAVLARL